MKKRHANEFLRTSTGRLAGSGTGYDDYSEEARLSKKTKRERNPVYTKEHSEYIKELQNQPVTVYKLTKAEMEEYLTKYKVKIQFTKDKITCCSQICNEISCPNFEKCKEEIIIIEEEMDESRSN